MLNKKTYSKTQKRKILEEFKAGKESQRIFCQRIGISRTTLKRWLTETKETKERKETPEFGIVHLNNAKEIEELGIMHFKTDNIEIKLNKGYDKVMLQKIFEVFAYVE